MYRFPGTKSREAAQGTGSQEGHVSSWTAALSPEGQGRKVGRSQDIVEDEGCEQRDRGRTPQVIREVERQG